MIQRESVQAQPGRDPPGIRVAGLALQPEETGVQVGLGVALDAGPQGAAEIEAGVAVQALRPGMAALQGENDLVIEGRQPVASVVAVQALRPEQFPVCGQEGGPLLAPAVAVAARRRIERGPAGGELGGPVAGRAAERLLIVAGGMAGQAEPRGIVVERRSSPGGRQPGFRGVAVAARAGE